ncbi:MAG: histidine phosphatase family protein [Rubrivivax sp.]|nr:histidine phosphatase family protein [Rubrivivax sp.]
MRHGSVDYFRPDGSAVPPQGVPLNDKGRSQAEAAGRLFAQCGVHFDAVLTSGLPRTLQTAEAVLAAAGQQLPIGSDERLQEIRPGRLDAIPREQLAQAFVGVFNADADIESHRFLGGESIGELLDRVLPAFDELLLRDDWHCLLLVLHGGVNRALIARALTGRRGFLGRMEQAPACINLIDVGEGDMVLRGTNIAPTQWLHQHERLTTMEKLLAQYLRVSQVS